MLDIKEILERVKTMPLKEVLRDEGEGESVNQQTYEQRLAAAEKKMIEVIEKQYPDPKDRERIFNMVQNYAAVTRDVYSKIGLQCGAALAERLAEETDIF